MANQQPSQPVGPFLPLTGIRVIDLTWHVAGPFATRRLVDYGADVIKIERPGIGDPAREMAPFYEDIPGPERSGLFHYLNLGKRSVTLDLKSARGRELVLDLARNADLVVESFRPRVMPSLGLDYDALRAVNPRLVMTSISNFGQSGPYRDWEASDLTTYAMGGAMINSGHPEREPLAAGGHVTSFHVGAVAAAASAIHLVGAQTAGEGDHVDIGAFPVWMGTIDRRQSYLMSYQYSGIVSTRPWPQAAIGSGVWQCQDGNFMTTVGAPAFPRMARMLGVADLLNDPLWATVSARSHPDRIDEALALIIPWMLERSKSEVRDACEAFGVLGGPINSFEDLYNDRHFRERGYFQQIDHPETGTLAYPGYHFKLHLEDDEEMPARRRAPLLGEHTDAVLRDELGVSEAEIVALREQGVT